MENNEISMFMDAKFDLNERKNEVLKFLNWTRCLVKIEAIKCFPSYFRITFIQSIENESANLSICINVPGLCVLQTKSRTKSYCYGLFWKQNRKNCTVFFALDSQITCERHMKWMKKSIINLELHRQEMLESSKSKNVCNYRSNNETSDKKNLKILLGPLPQVPDFSESWSRRVSGLSEIYEEILEDDYNPRRFSRVSIASGIYEEMKPNKKFGTILESKFETPPPLPPKRKNKTSESDLQEIPRSNTHPGVEFAKKKKYLAVLENVFGRSKRSKSVSEAKVTNSNDLIQTPLKQSKLKNMITPRCKKKFNIASNRNSFSSPDLTNFNKFDPFNDFESVSSFSLELQTYDSGNGSGSNEFDNLNISRSSDKNNLNISEWIQPNFNFSFNSSTINLVGANLNSIITDKVLIEDVSGYCEMAPIIKKSNIDDNIHKNENKLKIIESGIYEYMNSPQNMENSFCNDVFCHIYENLPNSEPNEEALYTQKISNNIENIFEINKTKRSINFDEKIPSYYPNDFKNYKPTHLKYNSFSGEKTNIRNLNNINIRNNENVYISSPQSIIDERKNYNRLKLNNNSSQKSNDMKDDYFLEETLKPKQNILCISIEKKLNDCKNENNDSEISNFKVNNPKIYQKYATLSKLTPNKYIEKYAKKTTDLSNIKKFASLPRFKKIDFSPLKMKISSVLQRHNSDGL